MLLTANVYKEADLKPFTFSHQVDNSQTVLFIHFYNRNASNAKTPFTCLNFVVVFKYTKHCIHDFYSTYFYKFNLH